MLDLVSIDLQYLNLRRVEFQFDSSALRNLRILNLEGNNLARIENLENFKKLRELNLSNNSLQSTSGLQSLGLLEILSLDGNCLEQITDLHNQS